MAAARIAPARRSGQSRKAGRLISRSRPWRRSAPGSEAIARSRQIPRIFHEQRAL